MLMEGFEGSRLEVKDKQELSEAERIPDELVGFQESGSLPDECMKLEESNNLPDELIETREKIELSVEEKQEIADDAARMYNNEKEPYRHALEKGIFGIKETPNGGVSFVETDHIFMTDAGEKGIVKIRMTGSRSKDFDAANKALNLEETPEGYVWHHRDDYNVEDGTATLELVSEEAHNKTKPHAGSCAQYDAVNGASYNPARKAA